jgi:hypothetical protein
MLHLQSGRWAALVTYIYIYTELGIGLKDVAGLSGEGEAHWACCLHAYLCPGGGAQVPSSFFPNGTRLGSFCLVFFVACVVDIPCHTCILWVVGLGMQLVKVESIQACLLFHPPFVLGTGWLLLCQIRLAGLCLVLQAVVKHISGSCHKCAG